MTKSQLMTELSEWKMQIDQSNKMIDTLIEPLMLSPESPLCASIWSLQGALTKTVAKLVGDESEWLEWFSSDNDMGHGYEACPGEGKPTRKIKTIADLAWLIRESK